MPSDTRSSRKRKGYSTGPRAPAGIIAIDVNPLPRITNVYGPEEMMDDPEVQEVLEQIEADEQGE